MAEVFRAEHIGSFLRPSEVKESRVAFQHGRISREQLVEVEDRAILEVLERQRQIGLDVFTDGEFRRSSFQNDLAESTDPSTHT